MKNNKGFSLVELIVVIAIMAILAAVAIPTFAGFITKANESADVSFVNDLTYAAELAHAISGKKISAVKVEVDANGVIEKATYKVGDDEVTITVTNGSAAVAQDVDEDLAKEAADTIAAVDWSYKFKAVKNQTASVGADGKLATE